MPAPLPADARVARSTLLPTMAVLLACALGSPGRAQEVLPGVKVDPEPDDVMLLSMDGALGLELEQFVQLAREMTGKTIVVAEGSRAAAGEVKVRFSGVKKVKRRELFAFFQEMLAGVGFATVIHGEGKDEVVEIMRVARPPVAQHAREGIVTLYAYDDLQRTFGFTTGRHGKVLVDGQILNQNSQLCLGKTDKGEEVLRFGCQGGERASVLDIGDPRDRQTDASLFDRITREEVGARLPRPEEDVESLAMPIELGHVYLVRIDDPEPGALLQKGETLFARVRVIDWAPGRYVTLRWAVLNEPPAPK